MARTQLLETTSQTPHTMPVRKKHFKRHANRHLNKHLIISLFSGLLLSCALNIKNAHAETFNARAETLKTPPPASPLKKPSGPHPFLPHHPARVDEANVGPFVENLVGAGLISIRMAEGWVKTAIEGQQFYFGDSFHTGPKASLRLVFEQGAQVLIGPQSDIQLLETNRIQGFIATPLLKLDAGEIRVLVERSDTETPIDISGRKHIFYVQTPSASTGVRGTDFLVRATPTRTEITALNGIVDVAADLKDLKRGKYVSLKSGEATQVLKGGLFPAKPHPVEIKVFLDDLGQRQPTFETFRKAAIQDTRSSRIDKKFEKSRQERIDEINEDRMGTPPADWVKDHKIKWRPRTNLPKK